MTLEGQVYKPEGTLLEEAIRIELHTDIHVTPPQTVYTDNRGRFVLYNVLPETSYRLTVEARKGRWATTVTSFFVPQGGHTTVRVLLAPPGSEVELSVRSNTVSVAGLLVEVPKEALDNYQKALKQVEKGEADQALASLERALTVFPDFVDARNELAILLMRRNKLEEARTHLLRALEADPNAPGPLLNLGLCMTRLGRHAEAIPHLEKGLQQKPGQPAALLLLGISLLHAGREADAETALRRAYELGGKSTAQSQLHLAQLYMKRKDYPAAARALEDYLRDVPDDPNTPQLRRKIAELRAARTP